MNVGGKIFFGKVRKTALAEISIRYIDTTGVEDMKTPEHPASPNQENHAVSIRSTVGLTEGQPEPVSDAHALAR